MQSAQSGHKFQYRFGPFCLDPNRRVLLRDGERVPLTAKSLATLVALVERAGETVAKSELLDVARKAWMYWESRMGVPTWNMQNAFRGHMVVLCDQSTASDGEAFTEGFKRLGLGKAIGMRTWGGEVWLTGSNYLADKGVVTTGETGVFGPEGKWLIEGHGVDPDITVDNLPHATFEGKDAQLEAAIQYLQQKIREQPVDVPPVPKYPVSPSHN